MTKEDKEVLLIGSVFPLFAIMVIGFSLQGQVMEFASLLVFNPIFTTLLVVSLTVFASVFSALIFERN